MNFLSSFYQDNSYQQYLNLQPSLAVCVLGQDCDKIQQSLLQAEGGEFKLRVLHEQTPSKLQPKRLKSPLVDRNRGLLKSDWCNKHQCQRFCCLVVSVRNDIYRNEGQTRDFSQLLSGAHTFLENSNCRAIVAFVTEEESQQTDEHVVLEASATIRGILGSDLHSVVVVGKNGNEPVSAAKLRQAVVEAGLQYHRREISDLQEKRNQMAGSSSSTGKEASVSGPMVRSHFKIGWHHLVMRDNRDAHEHMNKAYKIIRSLSPKFAPLEHRVCASIILRFFVSTATLCGGGSSLSSKTVAAIESHLEWLGQAFTSGYSPNCRLLLRCVHAFLMVDWYAFLASSSGHVAVEARRDYFFSIANCLQEILADLPKNVTQRFEIPPPPFLGTECANDAYANVLMSNVSKKDIAESICAALDEACALTSSVDMRNLEKEFISQCVQSAVKNTTGRDGNKDGALRILTSNWRSDLITLAVARAIIDDSKCVENKQEFLRASIHCLGAAAATEAEEKSSVLTKLAAAELSDATNDVLEFPLGSLCAPFTVVPSFGSSFACESVNEEVCLKLTLFSTLPVALAMENLHVELSDVHDEDKRFGVALNVPSCEVSPAVAARAMVEQKIIFPSSGLYYCASFSADVMLKERTKFRAKINFRRDAFLKTCSHFSATLSFAPLECSLIRVTRPASFAALEFPAGETAETVEGERINMSFVVRSLSGALSDCRIRIPAETKLFSCELRDAASNAALQPSKLTAVARNTESDKHTQTYALSDFISSEAAAREFTFHGRGLKNGVFLIPVVFSYSTSGLSNLEVTKHLRVFVDPPFSVAHTYLGTTQWKSTKGVVDMPAVDTLNCRVEENVLIKSKGTSTPATAETEAGNLSLYYAAVDEANCSPDSRTFVIRHGEPALLQSQLTCTARSGVIVRKIDVVCVDGVEVIYTSVGALPQLVEEGESISLAAKFCISTKDGQFTPGFVRVLFSPQSVDAESLVVDLPLPALKMQHAALSLSLDYPEAVAIGVPFVVNAAFCNSGASPFSGELLIDSRDDSFVLTGRTRWRVDVAPNGTTLIDISLIPMRSGSVKLPTLQLLDGAANATAFERAKNACVVVVLPGTHFP